MSEITYEESLRLDNPVYVDVRSPVEFDEDHVPGAINLPIFSNDERREVGTLYKVVSREEAVRRGTEIGGKNIGGIINSLMEFKGREIVIYCARGGMRSGSVAALVNSIGIRTRRLLDGYKSYRRYVISGLESIKIMPQLFVLQGLTGAGKTEILSYIQNSVDLEEMACHRSSVFGGIGLKPRGQKYFETLLLHRLHELENEEYAVIEGESKKIGNLHIPENIFTQMRSAPIIYIDTPLERRVEIIRKEYNRFHEHERVLATVMSLKNRLGAAKTSELVNLYNSGRIDEFIEILLLDYYDSLYRYTLDTFEYSAVIRNLDSEKAAAETVEAVKAYLSKNR
mgnify:CR=1 FL=1